LHKFFGLFRFWTFFLSIFENRKILLGFFFHFFRIYI
jgi:hypothetical protein